MRNFQNGDRVKHVQHGVGTIVEVLSQTNIGVGFDERLDFGHNCGERTKMGHGWYVSGRDLTLLDRFDVDELINDMGISPSDLYPRVTNLSTRIAITDNNPFTIEPREVKPVKLNELTQGLPLIGLRVMINPQHQDRFRDHYYGQSGTVVNVRGSNSDAKRQIKKYKENGSVGGWNVCVRFDSGEEMDINIRYLLPIIPEKEVVMHEVRFFGGDYYVWSPEEYEENIDIYIIKYQWSVKNHVIWTDKERQKALDEA